MVAILIMANFLLALGIPVQMGHSKIFGCLILVGRLMFFAILVLVILPRMGSILFMYVGARILPSILLAILQTHLSLSGVLMEVRRNKRLLLPIQEKLQ